MEKKIFLASPQMLGNEEAYVHEAFTSNWLAPLGPFVNRLECDMKSYMNIGHACALASGTSAIHLALKLIGVKDGDVVFCSSLTFSASANPIMYEKATPVFIDSDPSTYNMSVEALEKAFLKYTPKAVIVVHLYGLAAEIDKIVEICNKHNVPIIEDAAEALGSTYNGRKLGTFGKYGIISFNGNKIITTTGGGMLLSEDEESIKKALFWATQSREKARHYEHKEIGYNYRLSNVSAAIGCGQLEHIDDKIARKTRIHEKYVEGFKDIKDITVLEPTSNVVSNYWLTCITINENSKVKPLDIMENLEQNNVESRPIWKPMHMQPVFAGCDYFKHDEDVSKKLFETGVCLPSDTNMTDEEQDYVIELIKKLFS